MTRVPSSQEQKLAINAIRTLVMDSVQNAGSGHPGAAMSMAPVTYCLWQKFLNYDPQTPLWCNRDRFILSPGHMSALLYVMLYLSGTHDTIHPHKDKAVTLDDLKNLRRFGSDTPGHPEYGHTTGVETTTGPLGAGCSNSVGMAMASHWLAARYNKPGLELFNHFIYTLCSDGDMMEGVSSEVASLAGHLQLGNLIWLYDSNHISIEGNTDITFTEDVAKRFKAYHWDVITVDDANDIDALTTALKQAKSNKEQPSLIIIESTIAWGSPNKAGKASSHGSPLGEEEVTQTKKTLGWTHPPFDVPEEVLTSFAEHFGRRGRLAHEAWKKIFFSYQQKFPQESQELKHIFEGTLPDDWDKDIPSWKADDKGIASRASSGDVMNACVRHIPWMMGGSADLAPSTKTNIHESGSFEPQKWHGSFDGDNIHFGIREHAMGGIINGLVLYGLRAFGSGFLVFSDYMKAPIRLAALMRIPSLFIFTHDSIAVGEDGPTHQPIEQLLQLRGTPNLTVIRPADANEVSWAWRYILGSAREPVALILSRQNLPTLDRNDYADAQGLLRGGYILREASSDPHVILIATGSEVVIATQAQRILETRKIPTRVISMPSWEIFDAQSQQYQDDVLPDNIVGRVAIEAACHIGWERYVGRKGAVIGMSQFGMSGTSQKVLDHFGFNVENIVAHATQQAQRTLKHQQR